MKWTLPDGFGLKAEDFDEVIGVLVVGVEGVKRADGGPLPSGGDGQLMILPASRRRSSLLPPISRPSRPTTTRPPMRSRSRCSATPFSTARDCTPPGRLTTASSAEPRSRNCRRGSKKWAIMTTTSTATSAKMFAPRSRGTRRRSARRRTAMRRRRS